MMATPCYYCEENRDYACKVCIHHYEGPTVEELKNQSDRIRELEAKYEEAEACARCEHEKRLGIEAELAALRRQQGEPVAVVSDESDYDFRQYLKCAEHLPFGTKLYREAVPEPKEKE